MFGERNKREEVIQFGNEMQKKLLLCEKVAQNEWNFERGYNQEEL